MATALVADDSRTARMILARALKSIGYEVREAANGKDALAAIESERDPVQLVLADWNMPEMNGLDLLKQLRRSHAPAGLPVVMVTKENEIDRIAEALAAGANEFVMKPFTREILLEKLQLAGILPERCACMQ
jgi:two-component system chemotaxis response regulator CheY